jgi:hypothetical protein
MARYPGPGCHLDASDSAGLLSATTIAGPVSDPFSDWLIGGHLSRCDRSSALCGPAHPIYLDRSLCIGGFVSYWDPPWDRESHLAHCSKAAGKPASFALDVKAPEALRTRTRPRRRPRIASRLASPLEGRHKTEAPRNGSSAELELDWSD